MRTWGVLAGLLLCQGCAAIKTETTVETVPLRTAESRHTVRGSHDVEVEATAHGTRLDLAVREQDRCDIVTSHIGQKLRHERRSLVDGTANWSPQYSFLTAALLAGAGVYGIIDAQSLADMSAESSPDQPASPTDYQAAGAVMIGAGVGLAIIGAIDLGRLRDSTDNLGEVTISSDRRTEPCHAHPVAGRGVEVALGRTRLRARTDARGVASVSLMDVPEDDLPVAEGGSVTVGEELVQFALEDADAGALRQALIDSSRSRVHKDRAEAARRRCTQLYTSLTSREVGPDTTTAELADSDRRWQELRGECDAAWDADHDAALARYQQQAARARHAQAERACTGAMAEAREAVEQDVELARRRLDAAREACREAGPASAARDLAALERAIEQRSAELDAERETAALRDQVVDALERDDPARARALARGSARLRSALAADQEAGTLIFQTLNRAFERVSQGSRDDRPRLCQARALFVLVYGRRKWRTIVRTLAEKGDAIRAARQIKLLNAGACR